MLALIRRFLGRTTDRTAPRERDVNEAARMAADGAFLVDVREPGEFAGGSVPGAVNIPLGQLAGRLSEIPRDATIACLCRSGNRSGQAQRLLLREGYDAVNLTGGMLAWRGN